LALAATSALAQDTTSSSQAAAGRLSRLKGLTENFPVGFTGVIIILVILVAIVGLVALLTSGGRRRDEHSDEIYTEPAPGESSKFEQLLAETQGMFLRIQGGESKGYYRKIERLARIFLERIGVSGARQMSFEEIVLLLNGGTFSQKQAGALLSIFERCKQGAEHEGEKIDFTATELIKDLRVLVKQAAEETSPRQPQ
jgi:hypothetical protein